MEEEAKKRSKRIILVVLILFSILLIAQKIAAWRRSQSTEENLVSPHLPVKEKVEELGGEILGKVVEFLPGEPELEKIESKEKKQQEKKENPEVIEEPLVNIREQTEELVESIKKLPEDQLKAIKKQIYQEFCQGLLEEE